MSRFDLLRRWMRRHRRSRRSAGRVGRPTRCGFCPTVESLEPRQLLAAVMMESAFGLDPGDDVTLPITVDDGAGISSIDNLTIQYDTTVLDVSSGDVALGGVLQAGNFQQFVNVNDAAGTIRITAFGLNPLTGGSGDLFEITYHVRADAPNGQSDLEFTAGGLNEGGLVMTTVDGAIRVGTVIYDLNGDNKINFADFAFFAAEFLKYVDDPDATALTVQADFEGSGRVDFADLAWFAPNMFKDPDNITLPPGRTPQRLDLGLPIPQGEGPDNAIVAQALVGVTEPNAETDEGQRADEGQTARGKGQSEESTAVFVTEVNVEIGSRKSEVGIEDFEAASADIPHSAFRIPHFEALDQLPGDELGDDLAIDDLVQLDARRLGEIASTLEKAVDAVFAGEGLGAVL